MNFTKLVLWFTTVVVSGMLLFVVPAGAETTYHAFIVANDPPITKAADVFNNALLNWDSWKGTNAGNKKITKAKDRLGTVLIQDITEWIRTENMDDDDVILFIYSGHGVVVSDQAPPDPAADELAQLDPELDNDDSRDNLNRRKKFDESISVLPFSKSALARDDQLYEVLRTLPIGATKLFVFGMCHAAGECRGANDPDGVTNAAVIASVCEGCVHPAGWHWELALEQGLFDTDANGFAEADVDHNNEITIQEWFAASQIAFSGHPQLCLAPPPGALPIAVGLGSPQLPRTDLQGPPKNRGVNGCGVCSDPDFGDAPDNGMVCQGPTGFHPRYYQTTDANNGPRYNEWISQWLGPMMADSTAATDAEMDGQPSCSANGDGIDDEDGVTFGSSFVDVTVTIDYPDPLNYRLDAWWDWNDNGVFGDDPTEHVINSLVDFNSIDGGRLLNLSGNPTSHQFHYLITRDDPRLFYSRFRLTFGVPDAIEILPYGEYKAADDASHGEVEDYYAVEGACCSSIGLPGTCELLNPNVCRDRIGGYYVGDFTSCDTCVSIVGCTSADPTYVPTWEKAIDIGLYEQGYGVVEVEDGYVVGGVGSETEGASIDVLLVRLNCAGDTLWTRLYGGSGVQRGNDVARTVAGGFVLAGLAGSLTGSDIYLIKTDGSGDTLWTRTYDLNDFDEARALAVVPNGYLVAGYSQGGSFGALLLKVDNLGNLLWARTYNPPGTFGSWAYDVEALGDGGAILVGSVFGNLGEELFIVRVDASGDTLWTRRITGEGEAEARAVETTSDGGFILGGNTKSQYLPEVFYLVKVDGSGNLLWSRTYGGSGYDIARDVARTADGGYILAGAGNGINGGALVVKTDSLGNEVWSQLHGAPVSFWANAVRQTADGGYVVVGANYGSLDVYVVKTNGVGMVVAVEPAPSVQGRILLQSPYPNPTTGVLSYTISLPQETRVRVAVYDPVGRKIEQLLDRDLSAGHHTFSWKDARKKLPNGLYFLRLQAGGITQSRSFLIVH